MNKIINIKKKIDLLLISLEALHINKSYKKLNTNNYKHIEKESPIIQLQKISTTKQYKTIYIIIDLIKYIKLLQILVKQKTFSKLIRKLFSNYKRSVQPNNIKQYIKKFTYIYSIKHNYYNNYKSIKYIYKIKINEVKIISIINLYILYKSTNKFGIYFLIKYIFS
uniref:Uncharacterized protein n=1 Tax=Cliftonaea pectinata TaxID=2007206 RepID=A0A1Z1MQN3_9FLOR|nr:hypothetical protein [Cliftonaea pectinata]ARW68085.1 hypothetical protein [Cliftonaea pectinata]